MLSLLVMILIVVGFFKLTGFVFHAAGKILGGILGVIGWLILAGLAVTLFGLALYAIPILLVIGVIALIVGMVS